MVSLVRSYKATFDTADYNKHGSMLRSSDVFFYTASIFTNLRDLVTPLCKKRKNELGGSLMTADKEKETREFVYAVDEL